VISFLLQEARQFLQDYKTSRDLSLKKDAYQGWLPERGGDLLQIYFPGKKRKFKYLKGTVGSELKKGRILCWSGHIPKLV